MTRDRIMNLRRSAAQSGGVASAEND
jgi:hypothetical protein